MKSSIAILANLVISLALASCALLIPTASVHLSVAPTEFQLTSADTTKTVFLLDSGVYMDFDLNGSNRIRVDPGYQVYVADGIKPGWHYIDLVSLSVWVRGVPIYLTGGDSVSVDFGEKHLIINNKPYFNAYQEKNLYYSFTPMLSMNCYGCTEFPLIRFDGQQVDYVPPWISVSAGWHTIEITDLLDNVHLYFRTLFDSYTVTQFDLYPIQMN